MLRAWITDLLQGWGYDVVAAADAASALALIHEGLRPSLLFTDVFLGEGENGFALVRQARSAVPGLRVLLTSGERKDRLRHLDDYSEELELLQKPVAVDTLARAIGHRLVDQTCSTDASKI